MNEIVEICRNTEEDVKNMKVGDRIYLSGNMIHERDAVLPKVIKLIENGE